MNIFNLRREFQGQALNRADLHPDPFVQFEHWFAEARKTIELDPNAMCLSTVGPDDRPSARMVLLKSFAQNGFVFFTNLESRKAREMTRHPHVSLLFCWLPLGRQLIIEGRAERVATAEAMAYLHDAPPRQSVRCWVSQQ